MNLQAWAQRLGIDPSWFENEEQLAAEIQSRIANNDTEGVSPLAAARARGQQARQPAPRPQPQAQPAPQRAARPANVRQGVPMFASPQQGFMNQFGPMAQGNALQGMYGQIHGTIGTEMANRRRVARDVREQAYEDYMARLDHEREMQKLLTRIQHEREMAKQQMIQGEKDRGVVHNSNWYR
jgi:hypothetical protein